MGINTSLTIIAIVAVIALLILAAVAGVVVRTFLRLERVLARVEQDMAPLLFDVKVLLGELQKIVRSGGEGDAARGSYPTLCRSGATRQH